jgi:cellobiose-specific phosphotransferase system component IIA
VETNLFLAPGEGDKIESDSMDSAAGSGNASSSLPEALQALRNRTS